jgi:uncharacterized protein
VKGALFSLAFASAILLMAGFAPPAGAQVALPKLEARVTDLTGTLTAAQQSALEEKLAAFETRKGAQIAVLILPTTAPEDIAQFGVRLLESWKLGRAGLDDGAALIVAKDDRAVRIEVQYGLEGVLTDALSGRIINDTIVPLFRQGDFYGGVNAGVDQILRVVDGESLPAPDKAWKDEPPANLPLPLIVFAIVAMSGMLNRVFGRFGGATVAGVLGGVIGWWLTSRLFFAIAGFFGLFVLALIFGLAGRARSGGGRVFRDIGRGGSSGWGGFGGGSHGGGGWSGGGGRGGGGGASGRW